MCTNAALKKIVSFQKDHCKALLRPCPATASLGSLRIADLGRFSIHITVCSPLSLTMQERSTSSFSCLEMNWAPFVSTIGEPGTGEANVQVRKVDSGVTTDCSVVTTVHVGTQTPFHGQSASDGLLRVLFCVVHPLAHRE